MIKFVTKTEYDESLYLYRTRPVRTARQAETRLAGSSRRHRACDAREHLHQRPAYQARQRAPRRRGHHRRPRDGRHRRGGRVGGAQRKDRRPRDGQCRDLLRRMLLLQARLREQLHRSRRRLGFGLPHRRRSGGVCARALCRSGVELHSRYGERRAGIVRRRYSGHGLLGGEDFGDRAR